MRDRRQFSSILSLNWTASIKPTERKSRTAPNSLTLLDIRLFKAFNEGDGWIIRIPCRTKRDRPGASTPEDSIHRLLDLSRIRTPASWCGRILLSLRTSIGAEYVAFTSSV